VKADSTAKKPAKDSIRHDYPVEAFFSVGGGMSTLLYSPRIGDYRFGFGGQAGIGAAYHFTLGGQRFELDGSIEASYYYARTVIDNFTYTSKLITDFSSPAPFRVGATLTGYEEMQRAVLLTFPLVLRYHFDASKYDLFVGLGVKIGSPLFSDYAGNGNVTAYGIASYENYTYENIPEMGFGTYPASQVDKKPVIAGTTALGTVEFGARWRLPKGWSIYTLAYADVGINNIKQTNTAPFVHYYLAADGATATVRTGSAAASLYPSGDDEIDGAMAKRIAPLSAGIRVVVSFGGWDQLKDKTKDKPVTIDTSNFDTLSIAPPAKKNTKTDTVKSSPRKPAVQPTPQPVAVQPQPQPVAVQPQPQPVAVQPQPHKPMPAVPEPVAAPVMRAEVPEDSIGATAQRSIAQKKEKENEKDEEVKKKKRQLPYRVQVAATQNKPKSSYFDTLTEKYPQFKMQNFKKGKIVHYTYGAFATFDEAQRWAQLFKALGYNDAFVVQVSNDEIVKSFYGNKKQ
jgi:hypothetical protein